MVAFSDMIRFDFGQKATILKMLIAKLEQSSDAKLKGPSRTASCQSDSSRNSMAAEIKKKKTEFYITLALALIALFACLLTTVGSSWVTFAWFQSSHVSQVNLNSLVVGQRGTVDTIEVFPYDSTVTAPTGVYTFSKTPETVRDLGKYSLLKKDGNAVLFKVTLSAYGRSASAINVSAYSSATSYLGKTDATGALITPLASSGNSLSSIVCFYAFSSIDESQSTSYAVTLANSLTPNHEKMTFVSNDEIVTTQAIATVAGPLSVFYFVLDYDSIQIEKIYSANIGNPAISAIGGSASSGDSTTYISYLADFNFILNV